MTTTTTSEQVVATIVAAHRVAQEVRLQARTGYRYTVEMLKALRDGGDYNAINRAIDVCDLISPVAPFYLSQLARHSAIRRQQRCPQYPTTMTTKHTRNRPNSGPCRNRYATDIWLCHRGHVHTGRTPNSTGVGRRDTGSPTRRHRQRTNR